MRARLAPLTDAEIVADLDRLKKLEAELKNYDVSDGTRATYARLYKGFRTWCEIHKMCPLPADDGAVNTYLIDRTEHCRHRSLITILAAIRFEHRANGHPDPMCESISATLRRAARKIGRAVKKKAAATVDITKEMADQCDVETSIGLRDRAILLMLFDGAFRREELVSLLWSDLQWLDDEVRVMIRRSKSDQTAKGMVKRIARTSSPHCAAAALELWRESPEALEGASDPVFVSLSNNGRGEQLDGAYVAKVVKRYAEAAGHDPADFSGHSGRRGILTSYARAGKTIDEMKAKSGHRSISSINEYIEENKKLDKGLL